ncbi:MAG: type IV pilin protein [Planctomycetota bacterium]|jgi:general secretion pathway protein G
MKKNGFTLVELMIVVTILGILAAIVIPEFQGHASQSRESAVKSSLHTVRCQIELYKMQHDGLNPGYFNNTFTASPTMLTNQFVGTSALSGTAVSAKSPTDPYLYGPYLMKVPTNPFNNLSTFKIVPDATSDFSTAVDDSTGWLFQKATGTFKINYDGADSDGVDFVDY